MTDAPTSMFTIYSQCRNIMKKAIIHKTKNGQFRFNLIAKNGEIIATSETYTRRSSAKKVLKKHFPDFNIQP